MNVMNENLTPRNKILVESVRKLQAEDKIYGEPTAYAACAGELQRVLLKYASRSVRRVGPAEHSALDQVLMCIARIGCGPVVIDGLYTEGAAQLAIAGEAAIHSTGEARPVDVHERKQFDDEAMTDQLAAQVEKDFLTDQTE
jgi:hypothetical protein